MRPRPTFPECCATCEHRAVDTTLKFTEMNREFVTEKVYCSYDKDSEVPTVFRHFIDEVLHVCDRYDKSWGVEQMYRRLCGLPELPEEFYPYLLARLRQGNQESLRHEYVKLTKGQLLRPERQMEIWNAGLDEQDEEQWRKASPCNIGLEEVGVPAEDVDPLELGEPKNLEDCFAILINIATPKQLEEFKTHSTAEYHNNMGRLLRNEWGLWYDPCGDRPETEIHKYMVELGLEHADDMSGLILDSFQRHLRGEDLDIEGQVAKYQAYWKELEDRSDV